MIRIFKLVLLLVCSQVAFGQAPSNYTNINGRYRWIAGMFDSTFHIPKGTSPSLRTGGSTNAGGLFYNTSDSSVYTYTGTQWIKARGSINPSDTTNKYVTQVYKKNGSDSVFYVKGGNHLFAFVDSVGSPGGGGGGKIYYFNGGVSMGTIGGLQMYELGDTANTGAAANFTRSTTGNIANFITDPGKPGLVQIPAGVWSVDAWLSETGGGANHAEIWIEVEKWDGSTITTIATSPIEQITEGSTPNLYSWSVSIPTTSLTVTDRIIIQFYISNTNGKTVTLYTQNGYVGEVHTTFTTGIGAINGLTAPAQYLVTGTSGTDFNISSITATHTFNLPTASATNRGALSSADWTTFNSKLSPADTVSLSNRINLKLNISDTAAMLSPYARTNVVNAGLALKVNISDTASMLTPYLRSNTAAATYVPQTRTITINGTSQDLSANRTYNVGTVTSVATNTGTGITGGTITSSGTIAADTLLLSTRAWRQKGVDSLQANINTKQNTLTLTTFGTGGVATLVGATLNIPQYQGALTNPITGTGTANYVAKFSGLTGITNSQIFDNSTNVGIGTATPDSLLTVNLGTHFKRGVRMSGLPTAPGTRALRVDANGTLSVSDTLTNGISGSGTTNYIPKFTSSSAIGNSNLQTDASGNLGLGVTPSAWGSVFKVLEGGDSNNQSFIAFQTNDNSSNVGTNAFYDNSWKYKYNGAATNYQQENGNHIWYQAPSGTAGNAITFTQAMTLNASGRLLVGTTTDNTYSRLQVSGSAWIGTTKGTYFTDGATYSSIVGLNQAVTAYNGLELRASGTDGQLFLATTGNVGMGTTSPDTKLQVAETGSNGISVRANTSGDAYYRLYQDGTITSHWYSDRTNSKITFGAVTNIPLTFETNSLERMRITSGGDVLVGTQTAHYATTNRTVFNVNGTSSAIIGLQAANTTSGYLYVDANDFTISTEGTRNLNLITAGAAPMILQTNSSERMRITSGGEVYIAGTTDQGAYNLQVNGTGVWGAGAYVDGSDSAVKKNIQPLGASLDLIKQMNPVTFEYQPFYSKDTTTQTGFIAQELQQVLSDKVYKNGIVKEGGQYLGVAYQHLIPLLVKSIQELEAQVQALKSQLNNR
jgi:uncharacterized protein YaiE (UPF0345 family)